MVCSEELAEPELPHSWGLVDLYDAQLTPKSACSNQQVHVLMASPPEKTDNPNQQTLSPEETGDSGQQTI